MNSKLLLLSLVLVSSFTLSACTVKDQLKVKVLDKIDQKVTEEKAEMTDEELLLDLNADESSSLDADLKVLDSELAP